MNTAIGHRGRLGILGRVYPANFEGIGALAARRRRAEGMAARESSRTMGRVAAQPRTRTGRNARAIESEEEGLEESGEDGDSGEEQESDEAGDGLDGLEDRALLLEAVRSVKALKIAIRSGYEGHHEFKRLDNPGHCGICVRRQWVAVGMRAMPRAPLPGH
jgi:hypothetical protein